MPYNVPEEIFEATDNTYAYFVLAVGSDIDKWPKIARAANIRAD
jgi:hypothetical protein